MSTKDDLFEIADRQQGFFTSQQAEKVGIHRSHFHRKIEAGEWVKELRGVYRLAHYPITNRPELVLWSLWSRNRDGVSQGIWSYDTALDIHELSDIMPSKMHMTVPKRFRKGIQIPQVLHLHFADLEKADFEVHQGFCVTTPIKTLVDVIEEGSLSDELIIQAIRDALKKGLISHRKLTEISTGQTNSKLRKILNEFAF